MSYINTNTKTLEIYKDTEEFKMIINLFERTRKKHKLSQRGIAKILEINQTKYNLISNYKQDITLCFLIKFCRKFGCSFQILEGYSENDTNIKSNQIIADNIQNSTISQKNGENPSTLLPDSVLTAKLQAAETRLQEKDAIIVQLTRANEKLMEILQNQH